MLGSELVQVSGGAGVMVTPPASFTVGKAGFTYPTGACRGVLIATVMEPTTGGDTLSWAVPLTPLALVAVIVTVPRPVPGAMPVAASIRAPVVSALAQL